MVKWLKWSLLLTVWGFLAGLCWLMLALHNTPDRPSGIGLTQQHQSELKAVFLGTSSLMFTDGQTTWCLDCFLSRPSMTRVLLTPLAPNQIRIAQVINALQKSLDLSLPLAGVLVAHTHYDHAMDAPEVVSQYGGKVYGSSSTAQVALGQKLSPERIVTVQAGDTTRLGEFEVEWIKSAHAPTGYTGGFNESPLKLPAHALAFKEGVSYAFLVKHASRPGQALAIQPSAGYVPGQFSGKQAQVVFLGAAGLGKLPQHEVKTYWEETVLALGAKQVFVIHWDDFTRPLFEGESRRALEPVPLILDHFDVTLNILTELAAQADVQLMVLDSLDQISF